jgi:hypothetical protein
VRAARLCPGVRRIALLGSLTTAKVIPKAVDLLVTTERTMDLTQLARAGRRLKGLAQTINLKRSSPDLLSCKIWIASSLRSSQ